MEDNGKNALSSLVDMMPDTIHVLGFTKNPDAMRRTCAEVERAGFKVAPFWNFPTPYIDFLVKHMPVCNLISGDPRFLSCSLGHYAIWKTARDLGEKAVFVVEDDCRFVKDVSLVRRALDAAPRDADILLLDAFCPLRGGEGAKRKYLYERSQAHDGWAKVSAARSMACYVLGPRALDKLIWLSEAGTRNSMQRICDQWLDVSRLGGMKIYCAVPNLAIQQTPPASVPRNSGNGANRKYMEQGTDYGSYAEW